MRALICPAGRRIAGMYTEYVYHVLVVLAAQTSGFPPLAAAMNFVWYEDFKVIIPRRVEPRRHRQRTSSHCTFFAPSLGPCLAVLADVTSLEIEKLRTIN
jgi:hypothetical protein